MTTKSQNNGYNVYYNLEKTSRKARREAFKDEVEFVCSFYKDDFNQDLISSQLLSFAVDFDTLLKQTRLVSRYLISFANCIACPLQSPTILCWSSYYGECVWLAIYVTHSLG